MHLSFRCVSFSTLLAMLTSVSIAHADLRGPYSYSDEEGKWVTRVRVGGAFYGTKNEYKIGDTPVNIATNEDPLATTASIEGDVSYFLNDYLSFTGSIGYHPQQDTQVTYNLIVVNDEDSGKLSLLPLSLIAQYHFAPYGALRPYLGAGVHYTYPIESYELSKFDVAPGLVLNAGSDWWWSKEWGLSLDVKKYFMELERDMSAIGIPLKQELTADPLVVSAGFSFRINP
jgi:outer membrane protein W